MGNDTYGRGLYFFVGLSTASGAPTQSPSYTTGKKPIPGQLAYETDINVVSEWTGTSWQQTKSGGAALVAIVSGGSFTPTNYAAEMIANATGGAVQYDTMATGATAYRLTNKDVTAGDNLLIAFGADESEAAINIAAGGEVILPSEKDVFTIPPVARDGGKMAYISESANTIAFQGTQGV